MENRQKMVSLMKGKGETNFSICLRGEMMNSRWFYSPFRFFIIFNYFLKRHMILVCNSRHFLRQGRFRHFRPFSELILEECSTRKLQLSVWAFRPYKIRKKQTSYEETESKLLNIVRIAVKFKIYRGTKIFFFRILPQRTCIIPSY